MELRSLFDELVAGRPGWPEMEVEMKLVPVNIFIQSGMQASSVIAIAKPIWME